MNFQSDLGLAKDAFSLDSYGENVSNFWNINIIYGT